MLLEAGECRLCARKISLELKLAGGLRTSLVVSVLCRHGEIRVHLSVVILCRDRCHLWQAALALFMYKSCCSIVLTHTLEIAMDVLYMKSVFHGFEKCGGIYAASVKFKNRAE